MSIKLNIIDLHTCIQGEGKYAGIPHILIRLSGCNLHCMFKENICDTPYSSWYPEQGKYNLNDIREIMERNPQIKHTFITGGEPFLYPEETKTLISIAKEYNHFVAAETNGTLYEELSFDFVTISPKLTNSVPKSGTYVLNNKKVTISENDRIKHNRNRLKLNNLKRLIESYNYQLKFVVQDESDIPEITNMINELDISYRNVYLMPEGITNEQIQKKRQWVIEKCIELGFNYSDRLHIIAYGDKREA